ncbi:hypothetical protein WN51_10122 [Melipona quadrifasciata]|uniref:THD domain-containing protein n=1 Tax=Melipona quadrifasciata TaxID=166423 RepID=A0A0N0U796_9HYME|nr:hypothetical protein WN51_10122 [Melipona quadrifasciata]
MTSVLSDENSKVARMKQKLMNDVHVKEETRSFLSFFRENLSISQSDLEQGFNKHRFRPNRNTILSVTALLIALLCLGLESWRFHCSLVNAREIEELKRSVESLKHRFLEEDLLDELKAFEEQVVILFFSHDDDDDDPDEADIDNANYDSNYDDDDAFSSRDYSRPMFGARPSDFPDSSSTIAPVPSPPEISADKTILKWAAATVAAYKAEAKHSQELQRRNYRTASHLQEQSDNRENNTKQKRNVLDDTDDVDDLLLNWRANLKRKRSTDKENHSSKRWFVKRQESYKGTLTSGTSFRETLKNSSAEEQQNTSIVVSSRHPPKKYNTYTSSNNTETSSLERDDKLSVEARTATYNRTRKVAHKLRKNMNSREVVAIHYHGDGSEISSRDQNAGNGKIRHGSSTFKAWKPSDWVTDSGMSKHFSMSEGRLTIYETGLYLIYAQIHYNDDHDEIGFHLVVNDRPVLQCMIDNSGHSRNISQTCFSAQLAHLRKHDVLIFKEASSPRFVIFDQKNSFFGLVKLGELKKL